MDTYEDIIKYAVDYLLDGELLEENGFTVDIIKKLEDIRDNKFEINFE